jgi:mono/diheme cytochrome c family protein
MRLVRRLVFAVCVVAQGQNDGWKIPANAAEEKNPLAVNETLLAGGRKVFVSKCVRCHGPKGEGDGEDADMRNQESRAALRQNLANHFPVNVRQPHIAAVEAVGQVLVLEPEQVQNRGVQLVH